jgi:hypothetical protein
MFSWPWPESVLNGPAHTSPDGVYDFDIVPPYNREALALIGICVTLTIVGAMLRLYARVWVNRKVHVEDYLALFVLLPYFTFIWAFVKYIQGGGLFVHQWNIRVGNMLDLAVYLFVFTVLDPILVIPAKAAILLEWKRLFVPGGVRNKYWWAAWLLICFNTVFYLIAGFLVIYSVQPVPRNYNVLLPGTNPFSRKDVEILATAVNLFVDIGIFLLPQPIIWSLRMTRTRKTGLAFMFSIGILSIACAAGRLHANVYMEYPWPVIGDTSWTVSPVWLWWIAEMTSINLLLVAPSLPRAFAEHSFLGRFIVSLRSWTGTLSSKSREAASRTWPRTIGSATKGGRLHRLGDEEGPAMGLADLKYMQDSGLLDAESTNFSQSNTITRTIEVDQEKETASRVTLDPVQQRQHPWREV